MTQFLRPSGDANIGDWTDKNGGSTNIYQSIDEEGADDNATTYITVDDGYSPSSCEVFLTNAEDPVSSSDHIIRYTATSSDDMDMGVMPLTIKLMQGAVEKASFDNNSLQVDSWTTNYTGILNASQANSITDYTDLRLKFTTTGNESAGDTLSITQAYFETGDAPAGGGGAGNSAADNFSLVDNFGSHFSLD